MSLREIAAEWEVFAQEGAVGIGAVRVVHKDRLTIYLEGFGEVDITADQIDSAHDGKVVIDPAKLPDAARLAVAHAHDREPR